MEFLSRLIGGSGPSRSQQKSANQPQQRLGKFKRSYNQALTLCHKLNNIPKPDDTILELIQTHLQRLTSLLENDTRAPSPHLCLTFAASSFVYTALIRIAFALQYEPITREVISFLTILIDSDEENLLADERFAGNLLGFVDGILGLDAKLGDREAQNETLELIFGIAAKIRLEPALLPVWFRKSAEGEQVDEEKQDGKAAQAKDFPLCHHFVWHVYRDGRAGDFARTGLLYILESASTSFALESWIASSDLPTLMASGLGGLYSQLSRKLSIARPKQDLPLILALSDSAEHAVSSEADSYFSEDLQGRLDTFISYLIFWQDVLGHCHSMRIKEMLLNRFRAEFLEQILYPSLLQSSDLDGGSSVAVLTYLLRILGSVGHPQILHLILHYLLDLPGSSVPRPDAARLRSSRSHEPQAESHQIKELDSTQDPSFFNLSDLVLASCKSSNPETVTAALRVVTLIVDKHHSYAVSSLLTTMPADDVDPSRSTNALMCDLDMLLSIARAVAGSEGMNQAYESCVKDSLVNLEAHSCSLHCLSLNISNKPQNGMVSEEYHEIQKHTISPDDRLFKLMLNLLQSFLTNDIETNLALTSTISHLASCPFVMLEGWIVPNVTEQDHTGATSDDEHLKEESDKEVEDVGTSEETRIRAYKAARSRRARPIETSVPFIEALNHLSQQIQGLKMEIAEFSGLLAGRKRAFQGATELEDETRNIEPSILSSPRGSLDLSRDTSRSRAVPVPVLTPSLPASATAEARSTSPRGRTLSLLAGQRRQSPALSPQSKRSAPLLSHSLQDPGTKRRSSPSPVKAARSLPPLLPSQGRESDRSRSRSPLKSVLSMASSPVEEIFDRRLRFPLGGEHDADGNEKYHEASLTHVLTNVVILQEFILEIAAIIHVRAGLLDGEVSFLGG